MLRWFKGRGQTRPRFPYGVAVHNGMVTVVGVEESGGVVQVTTCIVVLVEGRPLVGALRDAASRLPDVDRRCVIAADDSVMTIEPFTIRDGNDLKATLETEALRIPRFGNDRIRIALAAGGEVKPMADGEQRTVAFASVEKLEAAKSAFEEAGFEVVAVDYEGCAWRRVVPVADALVVERERDLVVVGFHGSTPYLSVVAVTGSGLVLGSQVANAMSDLLHLHDVEVKSVVVLPDASKDLGEKGVSLLTRLTSEKGMKDLQVSALSIGAEVAPVWALAYGLATYALAEQLDGEVAYAF